MRRGVFAITWFLLLSTTLVDLYVMHEKLIFSEIRSQGILMDAEEAFYRARNFEIDFKKSLAAGREAEFFNYWSSIGTLSFGYFVEFPEKGCEQVALPFIEFLNSSILKRENLLIFSPIGTRRTCIALEINHQNFKTYGVVVSTLCVNTSSPLFLC